MSDRPDQPNRRPDEPNDDGLGPLWPIEDVQPIDPEPEPLYELPEPEPLYNEKDLMAEPEPLDIAGEEVGAMPPPATSKVSAYAGAGATASAAAASSHAASRAPVAASRRLRPAAAREIGQLWGSVFFAVEQPVPKVITVTAATRGEGATQIATALALSGASSHADLRIALVDANLRHPRVSKLLDLPETPGLTDVLAGRAALDDALQPLAIADAGQLHVLTAGATDGQPVGLLRSRQLKSLLGQLRERFDHIVIDTPAANIYPDPQMIGGLADGTILVVNAARTRRETVGEAKRRLELARVRVFGIVLNQRTYPVPGFLYRRF